jgi:hypothetical protein
MPMVQPWRQAYESSTWQPSRVPPDIGHVRNSGVQPAFIERASAEITHFLRQATDLLSDFYAALAIMRSAPTKPSQTRAPMFSRLAAGGRHAR